VLEEQLFTITLLRIYQIAKRCRPGVGIRFIGVEVTSGQYEERGEFSFFVCVRPTMNATNISRRATLDFGLDGSESLNKSDRYESGSGDRRVKNTEDLYDAWSVTYMAGRFR